MSSDEPVLAAASDGDLAQDETSLRQDIMHAVYQIHNPVVLVAVRTVLRAMVSGPGALGAGGATETAWSLIFQGWWWYSVLT